MEKTVPFEARVAASCAALLQDRRRVLVALSGGVDSVALLHLLRFGPLDLQLEAAHFDHVMREGSAADAQWVRGLCAAWGVPLHAARAEDAPASEAAARELRYAFLHAVAEMTAADAIATAHHADDQAETVLFRLARGTDVAGLAGIAERRGLLFRPLLRFTRAEIRQYAERRRLHWREDPSNRLLRYARNRIRHAVLPELERAVPGAGRRIAAVASAAAAAERAWRRVLRPVIRDVVVERDAARIVLARERLLAYDPHLRARVIRHLLKDFGSRPDRAGTRSAMSFISSGESGRTIQLRGGVTLAREFDTLHIRSSGEGPRDRDVPLYIGTPEPGSGTFVAGGRRYRARWTPAADTGERHSARFDISALRFPLELRAWQPGDRIRFEYGSKKVKKLLQERRVGMEQRARVPVLVDADGGVLWVPGVARSVLAHGSGGAVLEITVVDGDTQ